MKKLMRILIVALTVMLSLCFAVNAFAATPDSATHDHATPDATTDGGNGSPWIRLISFGIIILIIVIIIILSRTNTKLGLRIRKFFKEYGSEIKKVSWFSKKDTLKATGVVLVFLISAAIVIGVLDFGFTRLIQLLADIF